MATENQNDNVVVPPWNLRKQLALAVKSFQWSYAIFWSSSVTQTGILEWGDGFYNGEIKTRKTVSEVVDQYNGDDDEMGLQRSDELRQVYESLLVGSETKRPSAALSPEDLTDAEWYFVICMSFVFGIAQGLPGRTFTRNETLWLCNAHLAEANVFSRSLLAKSASIQTVACFPHLGGVIELGSTELVPEDLNLIQRIQTSFQDYPTTVLHHDSYNITNNNDLHCQTFDRRENGVDQLLGDCPVMEICPPNYISDNFSDHGLREERTTLMEGRVSQIQNWLFMDDAISIRLNNFINSSGCISETHGNSMTLVPHLADKKANERLTDDANECTIQEKWESNGLQGKDVHYQSVLSNLLKSSHRLILDPYFINGHRESSFVSWKKDALLRTHVPQPVFSQKLLKKVTCEVARVQENCRLESNKHNGISDRLSEPADDDMDRNHVLSERKRRGKINERFMILESLVPSGGKADKVSVLDHTIEYLKQLERRIKVLESKKEVMGRESQSQNKLHDTIESTTSDNSGPNNGPDGIGNVKKPLGNKRKSCEIDKNRGKVRLRDSLTDDVSVNIADKDVSIAMRCSWNESVTYEVLEAISKLHLVPETVQSSNQDGVLSMTIRAKGTGLKVASASVIRLSLQKVMRNSVFIPH